MKLVLASHNRHKAHEFDRLLPGFEVEPYAGDLPKETGVTFRDNAELKARHVHAAIGGSAWVLADDSGIAASALGGRPGVRSARFAGEHATDAENLDALLAALAGRDDRSVAYVAELVAISPAGRELHARGELRGRMAEHPRGSGGFGYDPAFVPEGETRTVGEMGAGEKDAISHRARAAAALREQLAAALPGAAG
jgi:XTP/dITP diphosphohydrolase